MTALRNAHRHALRRLIGPGEADRTPSGAWDRLEFPTNESAHGSRAVAIDPDEQARRAGNWLIYLHGLAHSGLVAFCYHVGKSSPLLGGASYRSGNFEDQRECLRHDQIADDSGCTTIFAQQSHFDYSRVTDAVSF
jgi:hypothetical protein